MATSVIDVPIVGMNPHELNGLDTVTVGGVDHRQWGVVHQMLVCRMDLLTDTMSIIMFQRQSQAKDRLGSRCRRSVMKTVSWLIANTNLIETIHLNKGS